jgi:hypothetical protein
MIIIIKSARIIQGQGPEETATSICADFGHDYFSLIRINLSDIKHFT